MHVYISYQFSILYLQGFWVSAVVSVVTKRQRGDDGITVVEDGRLVATYLRCEKKDGCAELPECVLMHFSPIKMFS